MQVTSRLMLAVLFLIAIGLLSLAIWSIQISFRLDDSRMLTKGVVFAVYALILAFFTFRTKARPQTQRVILGSIIFVLIGGEIFTRFVNEPPEDPDYRQAAPYVMFAGQPDGVIEDQNIRLNELGYRDLPDLPKPTTEFRIIMLGGSTVFNGSPRQFSVAGALEADLRGRGFDHVRVYNWGVYSVVSAQELAAILFRAVDYAPDLILVYSGANDLTEPFIFDPRPNYPFDFMASEGGRRIIEGHWGLFDLYAILLRPSSLGYTLFQFEIEEQITQRSQLMEQVNYDSEVWRGEIVQQYGSNLGKMCQLSESFDFQFVGVLQPMIFFKDRLVGDEPNWLGQADYQNHTKTVYEMARGELSRLSSKNPNCLFYDGSYFLQHETRELFVDPVHLTDEGRVIIGARLSELLAPRIE